MGLLLLLLQLSPLGLLIPTLSIMLWWQNRQARTHDERAKATRTDNSEADSNPVVPRSRSLAVAFAVDVCILVTI